MAPGPDTNPSGVESGKVPKDKYGLTKCDMDNDRYFPIAVVGIGLRMPMCETVEEFTRIMEHEVCTITPIPADRWNFHDFYTEDSNQRGHHCITKLSFCEKYYHFDPHYFNMSPREAQFVDPQQRQAMEVAEEALQDAGLTSETLPKNTGVYIGMGIIDFPGTLIDNRYLFNAHFLPGFTHTLAANRVSYHNGLTGPSCALDTACAASLTAIHVGCMSLWNKECEVAITGATSTVCAPETTVAFSHLGVLSPTGHSAPFDVTNNGYVRGEGTGILVLKPLEDAIRNGDHIYNVIRGTSSAHNGNSKSLTLPSADAQQEVIQRCYEQFGIPMEKVAFVEAHGTGTPVGDPLETVALGKTFGKVKKEPLKISSAKSNFGHLEVAAGMVQVVKAAVMLENRMFYKQHLWTSPNPRIDFEKLNLEVQTKQEPYRGEDNFLIGINTFGFGGSLVHMVFEEFPRKPVNFKKEQLAGWQFGKFGTEGRKIALPISAKTKVALRNTVQKWLQFKNAADAQIAAGWQATRRTHYRERVVFLVDSADDFRTKAADFMGGEENPEVIVDSVHRAFSSPKICFVFSGYGQQWDDMGRRLYASEPLFKAVVDECDTVFQKIAGYSALEKHQIFVEGQSSITGEACKPAILFMQVGLYKLLGHWGVKPDMVMGTGLGEMTAALASGALELEDVIQCMHVRMSAPPKEAFLQKIQRVINGPRPKNTDFYSTITGEKYTGVLDADYWWKNVTTEGSQKIAETVKCILKEDEKTTFIEIAASEVLLPTIKKTIQEVKAPSKTIPCGKKMMDDQSMVMKAVASLHCVGYKVNWSNISRNAVSYVSVPLYGWEHQEIRLESIEYMSRRNGLIDRSFKGQFGEIDFEKHSYLKDYLINDDYVLPTAGFVEFFTEYDDSDLSCLRDISIKTNIKLEPLHPDGFLNDVKINLVKKRSSLKAYDVNNELLAEATIVKAHALEKRPLVDVAAIRSRCQKSRDVALQYGTFRNMGLSYGRAFRLLEELSNGDGEAIGRIRGSKLGHERVNTAFLDAAFQVALAAFTNSTSLYLPTDIHQLHMYVPKIDKHVDGYAHAVLKEWTITHFVADLTITDKEGNVMVQVTGMTAKNVTPETSEVDGKTCLYTTRWQTQAAALPNTQICESSWSKETLGLKHPNDIMALARAAKNMEKLKKLGATYCRDVLKDLSEDGTPSNQATYSLLKAYAKSAPQTETPTLAEEIEAAAPELAAELNALKVMAEQAPEMVSDAQARDSYLKSAAVGKLLNDAVCSRIYHSQCAEMLKEAVSSAMEKKDVIRICQIGCTSTAFTSSILTALQAFIVADKVEYVCTDAENSVLNAVQKDLGEDVPKVSYEVLDLNKALAEQDIVSRSFDVVLAFDPQGYLQSHIDALGDLVVEGGWLVLTEAVHNTDLLNLLLAGSRTQEKPLSEIQWCKALRKEGFAELRTLATPDEMFFSVVIGRKLRLPKVDQLEASSKWILISSKSELAKAFAAKLPGGSKVCGSVEFLATHETLLSEESKEVQVVWMWDDRVNTVSEILDLVNVLRNHQKKEAIKLWFTSQQTMEGHASVSAAVPVGYLRAAANEENLAIYIIEVACGKADGLASNLAHAIKYHSTGDKELVLTEDGALVPRITHLDVASQPIYTGEWIAKVAESGVHWHASTKQTLKPTEVRISVRGMAIQSFSIDSFKAYAGVVEEVGAGATKFNIGDAVVVACVYQIGSRVVAPETSVIKKPVKLTWSQAAETLLNYTTAYHALVEEGSVEEKESVLVYPPNTGLGQAAIQIAKERGARVICAMEQDDQASSAAVSKLGMMVMADPSSRTFASDLMDFTDNNGVDIIFQSTKEDLPASCLSALAYGARICKTGSPQTSLLNEASNAIVLPPLSVTLETEPGRIQDVVTAVAAKLAAGKYNSFTTETTSVSELSKKVKESTNATLENTYSFLIPDSYVPSELQQCKLNLKSDATYVLTDAYGPKGQVVARWLADLGAKHVAMVDRSGCRNCFHKVTRRYLQSRSCTVYDIRADISKVSEVEKIFKTLQSEGAPETRGIFHVAAYAEDVSGISEDMLEKMKNVVVTGAQNLHQVSTNLNQDLDHFVLFSSSSAAWGNRSQEVLCAASNGLDALAHQRKAQNMAALSVQLGLVRGFGTILEDAAQTGEMEASEIKSLHMNECLKMVGDILQIPDIPAVVTITNQDWDATSARCYPGCLRISHLYRRGGFGSGAGGEEAGGTLENQIREYIGALTGSDADELDLLMPMQQFGVDSLMSQEIISWVEKSFKLTIEQSDIFGGLTCAQLIARIQG